MRLPTPITDHALLRYLERAKGLDVEAIRREIATPELRAAIAAGAKTYSVENWTYVIEGGAIVTVRPRGPWKRRG
jgi:hypothetical protein